MFMSECTTCKLSAPLPINAKSFMLVRDTFCFTYLRVFSARHVVVEIR